MSGLYYILSLVRPSPYILTWWREKSAGYTVDLSEAGKFSHEWVTTYSGVGDWLAIPCEVADYYAGRFVHENHSLSIRECAYGSGESIPIKDQIAYQLKKIADCAFQSEQAKIRIAQLQQECLHLRTGTMPPGTATSVKWCKVCGKSDV